MKRFLEEIDRNFEEERFIFIRLFSRNFNFQNVDGLLPLQRLEKGPFYLFILFSPEISLNKICLCNYLIFKINFER